jgi:hypothetical protein
VCFLLTIDYMDVGKGAFIQTASNDAEIIEVNLLDNGPPYTLIQRAVPIHPTVSELLPTMLGEFQPLSDMDDTSQQHNEK